MQRIKWCLLAVAMIGFWSGNALASSPQSVAKQFFLTKSEVVRLNHSTPRLASLLRGESMKAFSSYVTKRVLKSTAKVTRLEGVTQRGNSKVRVLVTLLKLKGWKVDDFAMKTKSRWISMRMVLAMKKAFADIGRKPSTPLGTKTVKGMRLKLGKAKEQRKRYLSLTFDYKAPVSVKLKKVVVKGLKSSGYSKSSSFITHDFSKPAKFPFKTDITLTFTKVGARVKGRSCTMMPVLKQGVHRFKKGKGNIQFQHFARFEAMGSAGIDEFGNYKTLKVINVDGTKIYIQGAKKKGDTVHRKRFMLVKGVLKNTTKANLGTLKLFVDGKKSFFPKMKFVQKGKDLAFSVHTNDFFYRKLPFSKFNLCYTPKQFNPDNHFVFHFKNIVIP
jgi:hypothetical protein